MVSNVRILCSTIRAPQDRNLANHLKSSHLLCLSGSKQPSAQYPSKATQSLRTFRVQTRQNSETVRMPSPGALVHHAKTIADGFRSLHSSLPASWPEALLKRRQDPLRPIKHFWLGSAGAHCFHARLANKLSLRSSTHNDWSLVCDGAILSPHHKNLYAEDAAASADW